MNKKGIRNICINLLGAACMFIVIYAVNYGLSWINDASFGDMIMVTLPFALLAILCIAVFGIAAEAIEEKKQREIRRKKRVFILKRAYRNRNKIVFNNKMPRLELFP